VVRTVQLTIPPPDFFDFVMLYALVLLWELLLLPRKISNRVLEALFPILRPPL
jgi:hypothetical protein